jgi:hypothetical protein
MLSITTTLLEHPPVMTSVKQTAGISEGMELALFRAREALLAGWHLTPDEAMALVGPGHWKEDFSNRTGAFRQEEDEVGELPLFFSEN